MKIKSNPQLRIAVLAAGHSRRLGRSKALARVRGVSLLRRTLSVLAPLTRSKILVIAPPRSGRYRAELRGQPAAIIANGRRAAGLSSSVQLALARSPCAAALLLVPVDLAGLRQREMQRLIGRWSSSRRSVVARRLGGRGRVPLILPKRLFSAARAVTGDRGLRDLVDGLPPGQLVLVDLRSAASDVDTPQDLTRARRFPQEFAMGTNR